MAKKKYAASVIGCGYGGRLSIEGLLVSDRYEIVAVSDLNPKAIDEVKKECPAIQTFADHKQMFEKRPTDIVCVSTWAPSHKEITLDALQLPLTGILVEKPLGDTAKAGKEILDAVKQKGIPMAVPHGLLVNNHAQEILEKIHNGEIGELKLVEIQNRGWDIINAGIHWLNYFVVLAKNEPIDFVMAVCDDSSRTYRDGMQVETLAVTYAQTKNGVRVVMNTGDYVNMNAEGKDTLFRLVGTDWVIEFWGWESVYRLLNKQCPEGKLFEVAPTDKGAHQLHLEGMAGQMDAGQPDYTIPESSLTALELCDGAYLSNRHGCMVAFPFDEFTPPEPNDWDPGMPYSGSGGGRDGLNL